jgi:hypothetical protein
VDINSNLHKSDGEAAATGKAQVEVGALGGGKAQVEGAAVAARRRLKALQMHRCDFRCECTGVALCGMKEAGTFCRSGAEALGCLHASCDFQLANAQV